MAGLEPELTNELLQAIGFALENNLDSKEAVEMVRNSNKTQSKSKTSKTETKDKDSSSKKTTKETSNNKDEKRIKEKESGMKKVAKQGSTERISTRHGSVERNPTKQGSTEKILTKQGSTEKIPLKATDNRASKLREKEKDKAGNEKEPVKRSTSKSRSDGKEKTKTLKKVASKDIIEPKMNGEVIQTEIVNGEVAEKENGLKNEEISEENEGKSNNIKENGENHNEETQNEQNEAKINGNLHESEVLHESPQKAKPHDELSAVIDEEAELRKKERHSRKLSSKHRQKTVEESQERNGLENNEPPDIPAAVPKPIEKIQTNFKRESFERPRTASLRPPSARPPSARPAAPRRRDKNIEIVLQPDEQVKLGDISVKMESFSKELEDDGENLVIIEDPIMSTENIIGNRIPGVENSSKLNENEDHGHLVQQILETQKEFSNVLGMGEEAPKKTEIVSIL